MAARNGKVQRSPRARTAKPFTAAVVQLRCTTDVDDNLKTALGLVDEAARAGAHLIATPENTLYLGPDDPKVEVARTRTPAALRRFGAAARKHGTWILVGSMPETTDDGDAKRVHNTSFLISPDGRLFTKYRKIHLFDVDLSDGTSLRESNAIKPGDEPVIAETPLARIGLSVCYDLRFPELYRTLAASGATVLTVPSAFTLHTGRDHWEVLLRARAIENQCYVLAPGQWGFHGGNRHSFGRSLIIDPWGITVANVGDGPGFALATLDPGRVERARNQIPCGRHHRPDIFGGP